MLDLKFIRENAETVQENCKNRGIEADVELVVDLTDRRSALIQDLNDLRQEQNRKAKSIGQERDEEARRKLIEESRAMKDRIPERERELHEVEERLRDEQLK
ncbi:MAG: serine--tRNA ligase, partial [Rubrobacter sp.]|nr:serine--tRNA ligase [Rubrobacter sp.]